MNICNNFFLKLRPTRTLYRKNTYNVTYSINCNHRTFVFLHNTRNKPQYEQFFTNKTNSKSISMENLQPPSLFPDKLTLKDFMSPEIPVMPYNNHSYLDDEDSRNQGRKVYIETYGCQMNVNDTEIAWAILEQSGFIKTDNIKDADVLLMMTCAIRESAEEKVRKRLLYFDLIKSRRQQGKLPVKVGLLGCMAERLKTKLLEQEKMVDVVCGPDAYRDLPRLLSIARSGQAGVNVQLSLEETYADVVPVRLDCNSVTAYVSIMRGCDNMCSYCIVPFTRGRERSRPMTSILDEVRQLSDKGIRQVTLLGQNVNSYRDLTMTSSTCTNSPTRLTPGFSTLYKSKVGGVRFVHLLDAVSQIDPNMRIRFTSPHPKDFPIELLELIQDRPNVCHQIHLPAQSGNDQVLTDMRRGYTRGAYVELVDRIRSIIPDIALSSDFIAGFCGETDSAHRDSVSLMNLVRYHFAYCYPYSMRQKTHASHRLSDDIPHDIKVSRHKELKETFRRVALDINLAQVGQQQLVLIEGTSKRSVNDLCGRNDYNTKVILPDIIMGSGKEGSDQLKPGDYVVVQIMSCSSQVLKGVPLYKSSVTDFIQHESAASVSNCCNHGVQ